MFSLQINNDGEHVPRVNVRWEVLPRGTDGIGERELAILAVNAMLRSTFKHSLHFELGNGNVSALMPKQGNIASLEFNDFSFDSPAVHASMHGRWIAASKKTLRCSETRGVIGYVVTYTHNMDKLKIE